MLFICLQRWIICAFWNARKSKLVSFLLTFHHTDNFNDGGKAEKTAFYNSTKGGVDVLDQNVRHYFKYHKYKHAGFHILQYLDIREYSIYI